MSNIRGHIDVFNIYDESGSSLLQKFILMDISLMNRIRVFFLSDIPD